MGLYKLLTDGWVITPPSLESLAAADACAKLPLDFLLKRTNKPFLRKIFMEGCDNIPPELLQLAENKDITEVVERYLGEPIKVASIRLFHSVYVPTAPFKSQLYHCDGGPLTMVKLFVNCSDIGPENGPFSFLPLDISKKVWEETSYDTTRRLTDAQIEKAVGPVSPTQLLGPKGTICLADTSKLFHYGARVSRGAAPRLIAVVQYAKASDTYIPNYE